MSREQISVKLWKETRQKMRMLYALTGKSMAAEVDRLVSDELARLQKGEHDAENPKASPKRT